MWVGTWYGQLMSLPPDPGAKGVETTRLGARAIETESQKKAG